MRPATVLLTLAMLVTASVDASAEEATSTTSEQATGDARPAADEPDAPARADELIREGVELRRAGREADAFERFRIAYEAHPSARALGQMGLAAKSLRRFVEAERHLEAALSAADDPWVQHNREALELARTVVGRELGSLMVRSNVDAAELLVNGVVVAELPLDKPVRVRAGGAMVELRAEGHARASSQVAITAGEVIELRLDLEPIAVPPPPPAPQPDRALPADVATAGTPSWRPWIYTATAVGGVGLTVGGALGITAIVKKRERDALCPQRGCPTEEGVTLDRQARSAAYGSTVSGIIGGVAAATAIVLWILEPSPASAASELPPPGSLGRWTF